jgi:hypothetical protein
MASRVVKEYLASPDYAAFGAASDVTSKPIRPPSGRARCAGRPSFAYTDNYLIDVKMMSKPSHAIRQGLGRRGERTEERS